MLEVRDLVVRYGDIEAVRGVSLRVEEGELVAVVGANGAGKTSVLNAVMGIAPVRGGRIFYRGEDVTDLPPHGRARMGIRIVPERGRLFPQLSVMENLMAGVYGLDKSNLRGKLDFVFSVFPVLAERRSQRASTLSGGEQQMLSIARALMSSPRLLLVDEVSMGLMPKLVDEMFSLLARLHEEEGLTILLVEQNAYKSLRLASRAYVLETGRIVKEGPSSSLLEDEEVRRAYLGG